MNDEHPDGLILAMLRELRGMIGAVASDVKEVKRRQTSTDDNIAGLRRDVAGLYGEIVGLQRRFDGLEDRIERIERRLDLRETAS